MSLPTDPLAAQPVVTRGPYLQSLLHDSVRVMWRTDVNSRGKVRYRAEGGPLATVEEPAAGVFHVLELAGLRPGTSYSYEALEGDLVLASGDDLRFRTAPPPGTGRFRAAVIGDSGDLGYYEGAFLHAVTALAERLEPDLFLHVGDYVYVGTIDEVFFGEYRRLLSRVGVFPARGNHDNIPLPEWVKLFSVPAVPQPIPACRLPPAVCDDEPAPPPPPAGPIAFYSFDWGPAHFAFADANDKFEACSLQLKWLCADLSAARERKAPWIILVLHHPPYTAGAYGPTEQNPQRLTPSHPFIPPLVDRFGVDLVLSGHDHNYQRSYPVREGNTVDAWQDPFYQSPRGGIYVITGGGGTYLYSESPRAFHRPLFKVFKRIHNAVELEVAPAELKLRALTPEGSLIDQFTIRKDQGPVSPGFRRGDANFDGDVDLADAVTILEYLFMGGGLRCSGALRLVADLDRSQRAEITDAIFLLGYLFHGGPEPDPPFRRCEPLEGFDDGGCLASSCRV